MPDPSTPPTANAPTSRDKLKDAHQGVAVAAAAVQEAQKIANRAAAALTAANVSRKESLKVEHGVVQWKADQIRQGTSDVMPPDLIEARRESLFAAEELQHAETIAGQMANELSVAKAVLKRAEDERMSAVQNVTFEFAQTFIPKLQSLKEQRELLRDILRGIDIGTVGNGLQARDLLNQALYDPIVPTLLYPPIPSGSSRYWKDFADALVVDPDAKPKELPTKDDLWTR